MIERIHGRTGFHRLQREGTRVRSGMLWCTMVPDPNLPAPQVAYAIGRSVGSAVVRNRVRRRLRAIVRTRSLSPGLYLIGAAPEAATATFDQLSDTVDSLLSRLARRIG